ncbi:MAG TPA: universal stress protein [Methylocella sp.]|jgi:nucleotide-binding universal stress UspA family protein
MYRKILIPTDGSELANKAVEYGVALAKAIGATITFLTVTRPYRAGTLETAAIEDLPAEYKAKIAAEADKTLQIAGGVAKAAGVAHDTVQIEDDRPYQAIIDVAGSKGCDLIVMASHGRQGISAILLGSETVKVLTHCKIPVLVHR